ncbi:MAG: Na+/H+ antiporter NhaA [Acidimicrobiales bacterium]
MSSQSDKPSARDPWSGYGSGRTWIERDLPLARMVGRPVREFLHVETASGFVLLAATIAALVLANTAWGDDIARFWDTELVLFEMGDFHLAETVGHWINDGLMAIFFFVVGLEIKRELVDGELTDRRRAAMPAIAALGGIIVPATIYLALNAGGAGANGWGIPMATDIAFAVGVLALLGDRIPGPLKVFLLTLAIVDDIAAITVIALFYSSGIDLAWLAGGAALFLVMFGMRMARIWYIPLYVVVGFGVWLCFLESGVHATIAGVLLGVLTPAKPLRPQTTVIEVESDSSWSTIRSTLFDAKETIPVATRLEQSIHPWSAFVILPLFAFANAGLVLTSEGIRNAVSSPVTLGVVAGLVIGKPVGVLAASWLTEKLNVGVRPDGVSWTHILGAGGLAGIGFTVALFVTGLAFDDPGLADEAKLGVLAASVLAAIVGAVILVRSSVATPDQAGDAPAERSTPDHAPVGA